MKVLRHDIENYYEDLDLVKRVIAKDRAALETLYHKYCERLTCFINAFVSSYDDVQDILQNTFLAVLDSLEDYKGKSQFFTWLCGIARHKIGDYYRAKHKKTDSLVDLARDNWQTMSRNSACSGEEWLLDLELRLEVQTIIGMMPKHYQNLLIEKYIHHKSVKELATARAMSEKAVESLLTRARKYFKRLVEQNEYFSRGEFYE